MLTITRKDLLLTVNDNVIPAMGSSDVPVKFVNDTETYAWFLIEPRVGYYVNGCPKSGICEYDTSSNIIKIPAEAFKNKGILVIAIALIDNADSNHIEVTKELALEVTPAPNGTVILPATDTWQTAVKNLVEQLYNQDYKPQFDEIEENLHNLVKEAQNQQNKANNQQTQIDNAIDVMGDYEIVQEDPTQIRFKKGDGTYGDTVNLGDNLAPKSMVNAGYDTYSGNSYSGSASDYGIEIAKASGNYEQEGTPTPESPIEPKFFEPKNVHSVGKNLFDFSENNVTKKSSNLVLSWNDNELTYYMKDSSNSLIILNLKLPSGTYFMNKIFSDDTMFKKGGNTILNKGNQSGIVKLTSDIDNIVLNFVNTQSPKTISDLMLSLGETIESYTPFVGQSTTPLNITLRALPNGVCDTYENGVITRKVGFIEFDGSEDEAWVVNGTGVANFGEISLRRLMKPAGKLLSNKFVRVNINFGASSNPIGVFAGNSGEVRIKYTNTEITLEELKTWLQSNPVKLWYELKDPTTEEVDLPIIPSYFPYTNAWHDSEVEASDLTWNILARQYGSGQTTVKKDEIVLTELDLNTERTATPTTVKVQLQDAEGKVLYLETSSENIYIQSGRFVGKTVQQVLENSIQAISATDEYIEVDIPDSITQSIDEEFLVDEVNESETKIE